MPRARCTYLVMCHTDPEGVLRLVRRIRHLSPTSGIVVRCDVPDLIPAERVEAIGGVLLTSDITVRWGDFSQVEAQIELLRAARDLAPARRYVIVSGQDYPIRDLAAWERELEDEDAAACFEPMTPQPDDHRLSWRVVAEPAVLPAAVRPAIRAVASRLQPVLGPVVRAYPVGRGGSTRWWIGTRRRRPVLVAPVKASSWSVLSERALDAVLAADARRDVRDFFRTVRTPDEYYLPSLVRAAGLTSSEREVTAKRFRAGASSPDWLTANLVTSFAGSDAAFARKVAPDTDPQVIAAADALVVAGPPEGVGRGRRRP